MSTNIKINTFDLAKFFYNRDIPARRQAHIVIDLWNFKSNQIECKYYENLRLFTREINMLLTELDNRASTLLNEEATSIEKVQSDLNLNYTDRVKYALNESEIEGFLKQCKLRLLYESKNKYIYMKIRTFLKACGYKKRSQKILESLAEISGDLGLSITFKNTVLIENGHIKTKIFMNIALDEYIRVY